MFKLFSSPSTPTSQEQGRIHGNEISSPSYASAIALLSMNNPNATVLQLMGPNFILPPDRHRPLKKPSWGKNLFQTDKPTVLQTRIPAHADSSFSTPNYTLGNAIQRNQNIKKIVLLQLQLKLQLAMDIANGIENNPNIDRFTLYQGQIGSQAASILGKALQTLTNVDEVKIYCQGISPIVVGMFIEAAAINNTKDLDLGLCHLAGSQTLKSTERLLRRNTRLESINLRQSAVSAPVLVTFFKAMVYAENLCELLLFQVDIGDRGVLLLTQALSNLFVRNSRTRRDFDLYLSFCSYGEVGAFAIASLLLNGCSFIELSVRGNKIGSVGLKALLNALQKTDGSRNVNLRGVDLRQDSTRRLIRLLRTNVNLKKLSVSRRDLLDEDLQSIRDTIVAKPGFMLSVMDA